MPIRLRPTSAADLDYVLRLESDPDNSPYVGSWSRAEHHAVIDAPDKDHWIIETGTPPHSAGYMIVYDLRRIDLGVHIKRLVVDMKSRGIGRTALSLLCDRVFDELAPPFVWLDVLTVNKRGRAAYRAAGFANRALSDSETTAWATAVGGFDDDSVIMVRDADATVDRRGI